MGSSRLTSRRRQDQGFKWARISIAVLSTVGGIDTGSITLQRWGWIGSLACPGSDNGCAKVLDSPWGTFFSFSGNEIPLSFLGFIAYVSILVLAIIPLLPNISSSRGELSRKTWWGLLSLSSAMAAFSIILLWVMFFKINAFCFFCTLSALISFLIVLLALFGGGWEDFGKVIFRVILITLAVLLGGLIWTSVVEPGQSGTDNKVIGKPPVVQNVSTEEQVKFAEYLTDFGVINYGAYWCPHCHEQKEMFGKEAASKLKLVECASDGFNNQRELCERKGIEGYPTWEIRGKFYSGVRQLKELAELTGYNFLD